MVQPLLGSSFLTACLYMSLAVCMFGILFRIGRWFAMDIGHRAARVSHAKRISAAARGIMKTVFSTALLKIFKLLIFDILLQTRILKTDLLRWFMHFLMFFGFTMLLFMHALDELVTGKVFPGYFSTLDPFQFLRNLFGVMVVIGAGIAVYRRIRYRGPMLRTGFADRYALIILAIIITTGFMVEGAKIASERVFDRRTGDFYQQGRPGDDCALKAF